MKDIRFLIVTGLSGAGKTQAVWCLEDLGFFCVDNLPPTLIPKFAELCAQSDGKINKIALVVDIRGGQFFDDVLENLDSLKELGFKFEVLFLDASDETLVRRFKESRRRHPLNPRGSVLDGIREERQRLEDIKGTATKVINTTDKTNKELKEELTGLFGDSQNQAVLNITILSFGFKYGIPLDADLVMDVRFLPNPFYVQELRNFNGNDKEIQEYVLKYNKTKIFLRKYYSLIKFLIPHYIDEGKTNLVIAIGCTGGQHRSVTLANKLGELLINKEYHVSIKHRDILRNSGAGK